MNALCLCEVIQEMGCVPHNDLASVGSANAQTQLLALNGIDSGRAIDIAIQSIGYSECVCSDPLLRVCKDSARLLKVFVFTTCAIDSRLFHDSIRSLTFDQ